MHMQLNVPENKESLLLNVVGMGGSVAVKK